MKKTIAIITAAGKSRRMGGVNKMLLPLLGKPILAHTIERFEQCGAIDEIVIIASKQAIREYQKIIKDYAFQKVKQIVEGGETRMESIANGLRAIRKCDYVLIHDGARPFIKIKTVNKLLEEAKIHGAAVVGVKPKDTIQSINKDGFVLKTFDRSKLLAVHTPVVARYELVLKAREKAEKEGILNIDGYEDSALLARFGQLVKIVQGDYENIKITTPEDVYLAERILMSKKGGKV